jgi:hypothetical protein
MPAVLDASARVSRLSKNSLAVMAATLPMLPRPATRD